MKKEKQEKTSEFSPESSVLQLIKAYFILTPVISKLSPYSAVGLYSMQQ